jgi:hypothetical protein
MMPTRFNSFFFCAAFFRASSLFITLFIALVSIPCFAGPEGGAITSGVAQIQTPDSQTTVVIQETPTVSINWQSLNLSADELLRFEQPGSQSTALNHILDQRPSEILGQISSNGRVFLMNPNGIIFGESARINVGSLVAGAFTLDADAFKKDGQFILKTQPGVVDNAGQIVVDEGGSIALVGQTVSNSGEIHAQLGKIQLLSADTATLSFDADGLIQFSVSKETLENSLGYDSAINNSGVLQADGGYVVLEAHAANDIYHQVVNNEGLIQANRIVNEGGVIRLEGAGGNVINSGDISAKGLANASGGEVTLFGDRVGVTGNASINASGNNGGGSIAIGGYRKGAGDNVSEFTQVSSGSQIRADAIEQGQGGEITVWADDTTWASGTISATGGINAGDGGFVEISGKQGLVLSADVDLTATNGAFGTLLLDPTDITIHDQADGAQTNDGLLPDLSDVTAGAGTFDIGELALEGLAGTSSLKLEATNNITVNDLTTDNVLAFNINSAGSITMTADSDGDGSGSFTMLNTNNNISTQGSSLSISGAGITLGTLNTDGPGTDGAITITSSASVDMGTATSGGAAISVAIDNDNNGTETLNVRSTLTGTSVSLQGGTNGGDTLIGPDLVNNWTVTSLNTGTLNGASFSNFPNLTGGSVDDTFTVTGIGSIAGQFNGGGQTTGDTVDYSGKPGIINVRLNTDVVNIEKLIGAGADNTLTAENIANTWVLTSQNDGSVGGVIFTDFSNLIGGTANDDFTLNGGSVTGSINGGSGTDSLTANNTSNSWNILSANGGYVDGVFAFSSIENLTGGNGVDTFILSAGSISGIIDGGAGGDSLAADNVANVWDITANNAGTVTGVGSFINIENLNGRNNTDDFSIGDGFSISGKIDGGNGQDTIDLSTQSGAVVVDLGGTRYANIERFTGNATNSSLIGADVPNVWSINGAYDGVDDGTVGLVTFINFSDLTGGTDNDTFSLSSGTLSGSIAGGGGNDTIIGDTVANTWNILSADAGTVTGIGSFSDIDNLTGNTNTDDFVFADASSLSGVVNGATGNDSVDLSAETGAVTVTMGSAGFLNIESFIGNNTNSTIIGDNIVNDWIINGVNDGSINYISGTTFFTNFNNLTGGNGVDTFSLSGGSITGVLDGGASTDTLVGDNAANTWTITAADAGLVSGVASFSNIENLTGNLSTDNFIFNDPGSLSGIINGAAGADSVDYSAKTGAVLVDLSDASFVSIETFIGNNTSSTLLSNNVTNSWNITGENDGTVGINTFVDFNNLTGNDSTDNFLISAGGSVTGNIEGGLGNDTLQGTNAATTWNITGADVGNVSSVVNSFSGIEALQGGNGVDSFIFSDAVNFSGVINGGGNTDAVDKSAESGAVNINLAASSFLNIESFIGNNSDSTLVGANTNNNWLVTGVNSGSVNSINFSGFNNITGNALADQFLINGGSVTGILNGAGGNDTLTADNAVNSWSISNPNAGNVTNVASFTQIENIAGGNSADVFVFATGASISGNVNGGGATDVVDFSAEPGVVSIALGSTDYSNIESFVGNNTNSTFIGPVSSNNWVITGNNDGTIGTVDFTNFNNLTGNTFSDNFQFQNGSTISGTIDGGASVDVVDFQLESGVVSVALDSAKYANIESFMGNNISSTFTGDNVANTWTVTGVNEGTVGSVSFFNFNNLVGNNNVDSFILNGGSITGSVNGGNGIDSIAADNTSNTWVITSADSGNVTGISAFANIENLVGNAGVDNFTFADGSSISGSVDGSTGIDLVDQTAQSGFINITLGSVGYSNIESFIGNGTNSTLTGENIVNTWIITGLDSGTVGPIAFANISNLQGGSNDDSFAISGGSISGQVDGGLGNDLILGGNVPNVWNITGADTGNVTGINNFSGVETLLGNASNDSYLFANGSSFTGIIDGASGSDVVDFSSEGGVVIASLAINQFQNIETFIGNTSNSTLIGENTTNSWFITGNNAGAVNGINFTGFNNLTGNASSDTFNLSGGSIMGTIDGGTGNDSIQAQNLTNIWNLTSADAGNLTNVNAFQNIDNLLGGTAIDTFNINANLSGTANAGSGDDIFNIGGLITVGGSLVGGTGVNILNGPTQNSTWNISGLDTGSVNGISFSQIGTLNGGIGSDTFNVANSAAAELSGRISGGAGNDDMLVDYVAASTRVINFDGGLGADSISLTGTAANLTNSYVFGPASDQVNITSTSGTTTQDIFGIGVELVSDTMTANTISLTGTAGDDAITLSPALISGLQPVSFQVSGLPLLQFSNKNNLLLDAAGGNDTVTVNGAVTLAGDVTISAETILEGASGILAADTLTFNQANSIGTSTNALATSVNTLVVNGPTVDAYISEADGLAISAANVSGAFSLSTSSGDITSAGSVIVTGTSAFRVGNGGSIILDNAANQFAGTPSFTSTGTINNLVLSDNSAVDLSSLSLTGNLVVTAGGPVTQSGGLTIQGSTNINANTNSIILDASSNDFVGNVSLQNSGIASTKITDINSLTFASTAVGSGTLTITAGSINQTGPIVQSANGGAVTITASAGDITLNNGANDFTGTVLVTNSGAGNSSIVDNNTLTLGSSVTNGGDLSVTANNGLSVTGTTTSSGGDITLISNADDIRLGRVNSGSGRLTINAVMGNVIGNNSSITDPNLSSQTLEIFAGSTIGDFNNPISVNVPSNGTSFFIAGEGSANIIGLAGTVLSGSVLVNDVSNSNIAVGKGQSVSFIENQLNPIQAIYMSPLYSVSSGGLHLFDYDLNMDEDKRKKIFIQ